MSRRRGRMSRVRALLRSAAAFLFSNIGVTVLVLAYTVAGAFMFQAIEGASESELRHNMTRERDRTANYLWSNITLALNLFNETELKVRISGELVKYQRKVVVAVRRGWEGGRMRHWSFSSGFLYSLTVITTIGYGNLSPRTPLGKLVTIIYALLGMPLFLLYLANVGELLARWFKCLYALTCLCRGCPGLTRRKVARLRTQLELSEAESIERPEAWRTPDNSDIVPYESFGLRNNEQRPPPNRFEYLREDDYRRSNHDYYDRERNRNQFPELSSPRRHYAQEFRNTNRRYHSKTNYNWTREQYRKDFDRRLPRDRRTEEDRWCERRIDSTNRALRSRNAEMVLRSDQGSVAPSGSDFTYITFDAQTITVPINVCIAVMVSYIIFGSMLFGKWEKWDLLDGSYFCFISLSSIGFGDFVPGERVYSEKIEASFIVCSLYLMLGMALVAMCFSLMQEQVIHYFAGMKRALKRICRCKR